MNLKFRMLSQETFQIEVDESNSIGEVKHKIRAEKGFAVERQKLIYNGVILEDKTLVSEIGFSEKRFIVVIVTGMKEDQPSTSSVHPPEEFKVDERKVHEIESSGYTHEEAVKALTHAQNDFSKAIDYIVAANEARARGEVEVEIDGEPASDTNQQPRRRDDAEYYQNLEHLRTDPVFGQLRDMVQLNPSLLPQVLEQMSIHQPGIVADIRANPQRFLELINETESSESNVQLVNDFLRRNNQIQAGGGEVHLPVEMSDADREAVGRLLAMGFPENLVIEAYFACDKNGDHAVNYILQRMDENRTGSSGQNN